MDTQLEFTVIPATLSDLNALRDLDRICFDKDQWPLIELVAVLLLPNIVRLKVEIGGQMVGFIGGDAHRTEGTGWVTTIAVLPEYRRKGIARALILACEGALQTPAVRLSVRRTNLGAQRLYDELGYHYVDVWKGYYTDGEDALIMEKRILK